MLEHNIHDVMIVNFNVRLMDNTRFICLNNFTFLTFLEFFRFFRCGGANEFKCFFLIISITVLYVSSSDLSEMKKLQVIIICLSNTILIVFDKQMIITCNFSVFAFIL